MELRENQKLPAEIGVQYFNTKSMDPSIIVAPTAFGKSILIANITKRIEDKVLILQPSKELLEQNYDKFTNIYGGEASIFSASLGEKEIGNVTYATIGSIINLTKTFKKFGFKKIIIDECDRYPRARSGQLRSFIDKLNATHVLGLTATPFKLQTLSVDGGWDRYSRLTMLTNRNKHGVFFKHILHCAQIDEMVDMKFWSPLKYESYDFDENQLVLNTTKGDYTKESMQRAYKHGDIEDKIVNRVRYLTDRRSILIALPTVKEAESLASRLHGAEVLTGDTPTKQRKDIIDRFRSGELKIICQVNVLTVGFDYPKLDCIITARPTNSLSWWYQFVGRVTRIDPEREKENGLVIDFVGSVKKFGMVEKLYYKELSDGHWELFGENGRQLTGIPMHEIGLHYEGGINLKTMDDDGNLLEPVYFNFGKYEGKQIHEAPASYRDWLLENMTWGPWNKEIKAEIIRLKEHTK